MNLYKVTLKNKYGGSFQKNKTYYVVQETKEQAKFFILNKLTNKDYYVSQVQVLGESLTFGNTLFCPKRQIKNA